MGTFTKNLSLYDMLSMIIPGGILLWMCSVYCKGLGSISYGIASGHHELFAFLFLCPLAYIVGIGNHLITTKLWAMFRNNPYLIIDCLEKAKNQFSSTRKLEKIRNSFRINPNRVDTCSAFIHYSFLTALGVVVFGIVLNLILAYMLNCLVFLYLGAAYGIIWMLTTSFCNSYSDEEEKKVIETYYEAYYYVQQKSKNSDISIMEGQVAFMQSMSIPLALLAVSSCSLTAASAYCTFRLIMFSLFIIIFPMVICRIRKIHSRVWEDYEFLSGMEDNDQTKK